MSISTLLILIAIGLFAGILSGMIGIGGGLIIVPSLVYFVGLTQLSAQGTSLALMLPPIGIFAVYNYYKAGAMNWHYALVMIFAFAIGGYLGSKLTIQFISEATLKKVFGVILFAVSVKMIFFTK